MKEIDNLCMVFIDICNAKHKDVTLQIFFINMSQKQNVNRDRF